MLPELPATIWELVIDHLWEDSDGLRQCALVCKAWQARCRFHLLSKIILRHPRSVHRLAHLLQEQPQLRERVLSAEIWGGQRIQPIAHLGTFASMLAKKLPSLQVLCVYYAEWQQHTVRPNTFLHLSSFATVFELRLSKVVFPTKLVLARLICGLPNLLFLNVVDVTVKSKEWSPLAFAGTLPPIRWLRFDGASDGVAHLIARDTGLVRGVVHLSVGWTDSMEDQWSDGALMTILQCARPVLDQMSLRLWRTSKKSSEQIEGVAAETVTPTLTLATCAVLRLLTLCCCLSMRSGTTVSDSAPSSRTAWLHQLVASITSPRLQGLTIDLDARHLVDINPADLVNAMKNFLQSQEYMQIDAMLADTARFKALVVVQIRLTCGPRTALSVEGDWVAAAEDDFRAMFVKVHARGMLLADVVVRD
ncbi:hypothetical protein FOMPIDRAFT_99737 [Fomitopsis schrenkii]|uniref:F-box domain-containing protein n=1 Tax=Fomitopsis schrenkii TaxID=2126942 RepID=S8FKU5_FOMSC|nr:hypothetical protein FOMPIDRAFT_99737 [Fomitopsis schrenkii]